jgi:hypothetical protein
VLVFFSAGRCCDAACGQLHKQWPKKN